MTVRSLVEQAVRREQRLEAEVAEQTAARGEGVRIGTLPPSIGCVDLALDDEYPGAIP
jgi:hypothetical protein